MKHFGLYTNRSSRRDFVVNAIDDLTFKSCNVYIAVAFFTDPKVVERIVEKGCRVRLIVRLGFPTQPAALERLLNIGIEIRYFTDTAFHPKVYLFGNQTALVGSANLTQSAIMSNQEVVVQIESEDPRLNELAILFSEYWAQAKVLTGDIVAEYKLICEKYTQISKEQYRLEQEIRQKMGRVFAGDLIKDKVIKSKESIFLEGFRKTYQEFVTAFSLLTEIYESVGRRKVPEEVIPLRLEIDSFISFVRDIHAQGEDWVNAPIRGTEEQRKLIEPLVKEWIETPWPHFENTIVKNSYPRLRSVFENQKSIIDSTNENLIEALCSEHSFHDRFRFFPGGLPTLKVEFLKANDPGRLRENLAYLLHGVGSIEDRMANLIYNPEYKLNEFGQSNVQELVGWCNKENLPVVNGRTTKVLRWFGFDVTQVG